MTAFNRSLNTIPRTADDRKERWSEQFYDDLVEGNNSKLSAEFTAYCYEHAWNEKVDVAMANFCDMKADSQEKDYQEGLVADQVEAMKHQQTRY